MKLKAIRLLLLTTALMLLVGCGDTQSVPPTATTVPPTATTVPPTTSIPPPNLRPFQNQGVGIQFWNRAWVPSIDDPMRAEFIESLDLLTKMNVNYVHIHFGVLIDSTLPNGVVFDRTTDVTLTDGQFYDLVARLKERGSPLTSNSVSGTPTLSLQ